MLNEIPERDWKIFRQLHPIALERFGQRAVAEIQRLTAQGGQPPMEQFWNAFEFAAAQKKRVSDLFDDYRRSTAMMKVAELRDEGLLTEAEIARFSPEFREWLNGLRSLSRR
jgi:hypothetical protein